MPSCLVIEKQAHYKQVYIANNIFLIKNGIEEQQDTEKSPEREPGEKHRSFRVINKYVFQPISHFLVFIDLLFVRNLSCLINIIPKGLHKSAKK